MQKKSRHIPSLLPLLYTMHLPKSSHQTTFHPFFKTLYKPPQLFRHNLTIFNFFLSLCRLFCKIRSIHVQFKVLITDKIQRYILYAPNIK